MNIDMNGSKVRIFLRVFTGQFQGGPIVLAFDS
jgi:hypothetical protein